MAKIDMEGWGAFGDASFIIGKDKYHYRLDAAIAQTAYAVARKNPGRALDMVKKASTEVRKNLGEWKPVKETKNAMPILS